MKRKIFFATLVVGVLSMIGLARCGHAASTPVWGADHWSLGLTGAFVTHAGDQVPAGTEFEHGFLVRMPVALSVISPPPDKHGLRASLFVAPTYLLDTRWKNGTTGWDFGVSFGIWQGRIAP